MTPDVRQKAVRIRRAPGRVQRSQYVVVTIPMHVNQLALFQPGDEVVVRSRGRGQVTVSLLRDLPVAMRKIHSVRVDKLTDEMVADLKQAWEMGVSHGQKARAMDISVETARQYYNQFKSGRL